MRRYHFYDIITGLNYLMIVGLYLLSAYLILLDEFTTWRVITRANSVLEFILMFFYLTVIWAVFIVGTLIIISPVLNFAKKYKKKQQKERMFREKIEDAKTALALESKSRILDSFEGMKWVWDDKYSVSEKLRAQVEQTNDQLIDWMLTHGECTNKDLEMLYQRCDDRHHEQIAAKIVALPTPTFKLLFWVVNKPHPSHLRLQAIERMAESPTDINTPALINEVLYWALERKEDDLVSAILKLLKAVDFNSKQLLGLCKNLSYAFFEGHEQFLEILTESKRKLLARELVMYVEFHGRFWVPRFRDKDGVEFKEEDSLIPMSSIRTLLSEIPLLSGKALLDTYGNKSDFWRFKEGD